MRQHFIWSTTTLSTHHHSHRIHSMANFLCKQWWRHMTSQLSARGFLILFIKMNSFQEFVKQTVKKEGGIQLFAPLNFNFLLMPHLSFLKQPYWIFSLQQLNFFLFGAKQYNKSFLSFFYDPNNYLVKFTIPLNETIVFPQ